MIKYIVINPMLSAIWGLTVGLAVGYCLGSFYYGGGYLVVSYIASKL